MPAFSQYTYIFAITVIFTFLDAWNIGECRLPPPPADQH